MKILVTGAAGFIGSAVAAELLRRGHTVTGLDNLNGYYDPALKRARAEALKPSVGFRFEEADITDGERLPGLFRREGFDRVVHLAAQPGVGHSIANARACGDVNLTGFLNVLENCRHHGCGLVYASSSSVYGDSARVPFSEKDAATEPLSLYAATKRSNELMAGTYGRLYGLKTAGLRFFTVYGPWGRPDMSPMLFAGALMRPEPVKLFGGGRPVRDFTHVSDVAAATATVVEKLETASHGIYNVGRGEPVSMAEFLALLKEALGRECLTELLPPRRGDVERTWADTARLEADFGLHPRVTLREGLAGFADWVKAHWAPEGWRWKTPASERPAF